VLEIGRIIFDLLPQLRHVRIHCAVGDIHLFSPNLVENEVTAEDIILMLDKKMEQIKFERR